MHKSATERAPPLPALGAFPAAAEEDEEEDEEEAEEEPVVCS